MASNSSSGHNIENNVMDGNALAGVTFVNTDESAVSSNNIIGSQNAIFLDEQSNGNTVQLNGAHDNVVDLNNANGLAPKVNLNTFSDNNCDVSDPAGLCSNTTSSQVAVETANKTIIQENITQQTAAHNPEAVKMLINDAYSGFTK